MKCALLSCLALPLPSSSLGERSRLGGLASLSRLDRVRWLQRVHDLSRLLGQLLGTVRTRYEVRHRHSGGAATVHEYAAVQIVRSTLRCHRCSNLKPPPSHGCIITRESIAPHFPYTSDECLRVDDLANNALVSDRNDRSHAALCATEVLFGASSLQKRIKNAFSVVRCTDKSSLPSASQHIVVRLALMKSKSCVQDYSRLVELSFLASVLALHDTLSMSILGDGDCPVPVTLMLGPSFGELSQRSALPNRHRTECRRRPAHRVQSVQSANKSQPHQLRRQIMTWLSR